MENTDQGSRGVQPYMKGTFHHSYREHSILSPGNRRKIGI
jgi:hypothetical protein